MTPRQILRMHAVLLIAVNVLCVYLLGAADAEGDFYHFKIVALILAFVSIAIAVTGYLAVRRSWLGQPPSDFKDGILPLFVLFALGFGIWALGHVLGAKGP